MLTNRHTLANIEIQKGVSIIELMIGILISLIVLAGVVQVAFTSKATFLGQEDMSYIQQNSRYAMYMLTKDIQNAGYWGCASEDADVALVAKTANNADINRLLGINPANAYLEPLSAITGYTSGFPSSYSTWSISTADGARTPESFIVRSASGTPTTLDSQVGTNLLVKSAHQFSTGDLVTIVAEDCRRMGIFKTVDIYANSTIVKYSSDSICGDRIKPPRDQSVRCHSDCVCDQVSGASENYGVGSQIMPYNAFGYFIGESITMEGQPSLQRIKYDDGELTREELALGVEDMQILYGVDSDDDGVADTFVSASAFTVAEWNKWNQVRSVQINLLFRSINPTLPSVETHTYLAKNYQDRYLRQMVSATVRMRNSI